MKKFRFWLGVIFPIILAIAGYFLAGLLPLPPDALEQSKLLYGLLGLLLGILTFGQVTRWIVKTSTNLIRQLTLRIATEVISQFTQLRERDLNIFRRNPEEEEIENGNSLLVTKASSKVKPQILVLDTSSIIDARVLDVAKLGFLDGVIIVPKFVLTELQQVADSADSLKRNRGRKGFDIIDQLKKIKQLKVLIWEKDVKAKEVDDKLIKLAKELKGKILTCDYNLNKVASLSGVTVLNLNELSNALKTYALPGENFQVKVIQKGKDDGQGVGFLDDGTMVVVDKGAKLIGKQIQVEATKIIQNPAGRMIFGKTL